MLEQHHFEYESFVRLIYGAFLKIQECSLAEAFLEPCQISMMQLFQK